MVKFKKEFLTDPNLVIECKEFWQRDDFLEWCESKGVETGVGGMHYSHFRIKNKLLFLADKEDYDRYPNFIIIPYEEAIKKKKTPADKLRKLLSKMDTSEVQEILQEYNETTKEEMDVECNDKLMVDKPKYDTNYFCFNYAGEIDNSKWFNDKFDNHIYNSGGVYIEKEHAELAAQRLKDKLSDDISKTFLWIENWLIRNDDGWRADWNDNTQAKYFIYYNHSDDSWGTDCSAAYNCNQIVMSKENADKLIEILKNK